MWYKILYLYSKQLVNFDTYDLYSPATHESFCTENMEYEAKSFKRKFSIKEKIFFFTEQFIDYVIIYVYNYTLYVIKINMNLIAKTINNVIKNICTTLRYTLSIHIKWCNGNRRKRRFINIIFLWYSSSYSNLHAISFS